VYKQVDWSYCSQRTSYFRTRVIMNPQTESTLGFQFAPTATGIAVLKREMRVPFAPKKAELVTFPAYEVPFEEFPKIFSCISSLWYYEDERKPAYMALELVKACGSRKDISDGVATTIKGLLSLYPTEPEGHTHTEDFLLAALQLNWNWWKILFNKLHKDGNFKSSTNTVSKRVLVKSKLAHAKLIYKEYGRGAFPSNSALLVLIQRRYNVADEKCRLFIRELISEGEVS
jgi:hypothetical protein